MQSFLLAYILYKQAPLLPKEDDDKPILYVVLVLIKERTRTTIPNIKYCIQMLIIIPLQSTFIFTKYK